MFKYKEDIVKSKQKKEQDWVRGNDGWEQRR